MEEKGSYSDEIAEWHWQHIGWLLCAEALMEAGSSFINTRQPRSQSKKSINSREYSKQAALRLCVCGYL